MSSLFLEDPLVRLKAVAVKARQDTIDAKKRADEAEVIAVETAKAAELAKASAYLLSFLEPKEKKDERDRLIREAEETRATANRLMEIAKALRQTAKEAKSLFEKMELERTDALVSSEERALALVKERQEIERKRREAAMEQEEALKLSATRAAKFKLEVVKNAELEAHKAALEYKKRQAEKELASMLRKGSDYKKYLKYKKKYNALKSL